MTTGSNYHTLKAKIYTDFFPSPFGGQSMKSVSLNNIKVLAGTHIPQRM